MPIFVEEKVVGNRRPEVVEDLISRFEAHCARIEIEGLLGKLPKHQCIAPWFERCRAEKREQAARTKEQGGTR